MSPRLILLLLVGSELFIIPAFILVSTNEVSHKALSLMLFLAGAIAIPWLIWRAMRRNSAEAQWAWGPGMPAERYQAQLSLFLRLQGWRIVSSAIGDGGRPELVLRRDRWRVALLCVGPDQPPCRAADLTRLTDLAREHGAARSAIVAQSLEATTPTDKPDAGTGLRLRFEDLAYLDVSFGLAL